MVLPEKVTIDLPGIKTDVLIAGSGPTLTILPRDIGRVWGRLHDELCKSYRVVAPALPGFDNADRPMWLRNVGDLAALVGNVLDSCNKGPSAILGLGFGAWVAAELAARSPSRVSAMVLHAPLGIKPRSGEILDQFLISADEFVRMGFANPDSNFKRIFPDAESTDLELWDNNREMSTRLAWKPYMFNPALPYLLRNVHVSTLVLWGSGDRIVPKDCAVAYCDALSNSRYLEIGSTGHLVDIEDPEILIDAVLAGLKSVH